MAEQQRTFGVLTPINEIEEGGNDLHQWVPLQKQEQTSGSRKIGTRKKGSDSFALVTVELTSSATARRL